MTSRRLYLAAYDVADRKRRHASLHLVKGHTTGGQKSAYECFLADPERGRLILDIAQILIEAEDSFVLIGLDPRSRVYTLGIGDEPVDPSHFYIG